MKKDTQISTKVLEAMYKLKNAECRLFKDELYSAVNYIEEAKRLIQSEIQEKFGLDK